MNYRKYNAWLYNYIASKYCADSHLLCNIESCFILDFLLGRGRERKEVVQNRTEYFTDAPEAIIKGAMFHVI